MITAKEAREQANKINKDNELALVNSQIEQSIARGQYSIAVYDDLSDVTCTALAALGYKVEYKPGMDCRDSSYWKISW